MSDFAVVCRVFDSWAPLGGGIHDWISYDDRGMLDEYHRYVRIVIEQLKRGVDLEYLEIFFDCIAFDRMARTRNSETVAEAKYGAWTLYQVWKNHCFEGSNTLSVPLNWRDHGAHRATHWSMFEIIHLVLEDWDPFRTKELWLHGADTLQTYDDFTFDLLNLLSQGASTDEVLSRLMRVFIHPVTEEIEIMHQARTRPVARALTRLYWDFEVGQTEEETNQYRIAKFKAGLSDLPRDPSLSRADLFFEGLRLPKDASAEAK